MSTTYPKLYAASYHCYGCHLEFEKTQLDYPGEDVDCPECNNSVWPTRTWVESSQVDDPELDRRLNDYRPWLEQLWHDFGRSTVEEAIKNHPAFQSSTKTS